MKTLVIILVINAIALIGMILTIRNKLKDLEEEYQDEKLELENKILNYKKLIFDLDIEIKDCNQTQFYGNTKLALRKISNIVNKYRNID